MACLLSTMVNWVSRAELHRLKYKIKYSSVSAAPSIPFRLSLVTILSNCSVVTASWPGTGEVRCCRSLKQCCKLWVVMSPSEPHRKNLSLYFCTRMHLISVLQSVLSGPTSSCWLSVESSMPSVASPFPTWSATTRRMTGGILWRPCQTLLQNSQLVNARARSTLLEDTLHEVTRLLLIVVAFYLLVSKAQIIFSCSSWKLLNSCRRLRHAD